MYFCERHEKILEILKENGSVSVERLSQLLFVSLPTVRRDLAFLKEQNLIHRTFGGATLRNRSADEIPFELRDSEDADVKAIIAQNAAKHLGDDAVIFLDASSTVYRLLPYISKFKDITVITNSPKVCLGLAEQGISAYCTGGTLLTKSKAFVGEIAEAFVRKFNIATFFFSSQGITEDGMITDSSVVESEIRKVVMSQSGKNIFMCSSQKIGKKFAYNVAHISEVDAIISDVDTDKIFKTK